MKYIVTSSGLEAREVNPYFCESMSAYTCYELPEASICNGCKNHTKFEESVKTYPLTQPMEPGSEIECEDEPVWQYYDDTDGWNGWFKCTALHDVDERNGYKTRQALQPIIPQPEKVKEESLEDSLRPEQFNSFRQILKDRKQYTIWSESAKVDIFLFMKDACEQQHKATIDKVVEVIEASFIKEPIGKFEKGVNNGLEYLLTQIKEI